MYFYFVCVAEPTAETVDTPGPKKNNFIGNICLKLLNTAIESW